MNPCPCGWLGDDSGRCRCTPDRVARYRARVSGPLVDRIDLWLEVPALPAGELRAAAVRPEASGVVGARVARASERQRQRQGCANARLPPGALDAHCSMGAPAEDMLHQAMRRLALSARSFDRVRRVARTIADLAGAGTIDATHLAEAIGYRRLDAVAAGARHATAV
jgi:magnesium chelatase family protein